MVVRVVVPTAGRCGQQWYVLRREISVRLSVTVYAYYGFETAMLRAFSFLLVSWMTSAVATLIIS